MSEPAETTPRAVDVHEAALVSQGWTIVPGVVEPELVDALTPHWFRRWRCAMPFALATVSPKTRMARCTTC
ncbi:MAG: hypothetical protein WDN30_15060 [Pararobbsia sp.]